jgi:hypothetical protein
VTTPVPVPTIYFEEAMLRENMMVGGFDLHALSYRGPAGCGILRPVSAPVVETVPPGQIMPPEPMLTLSHRSAQALFDALYKVGLRPSSGESVENHKRELEATRAHLADMRALAFHAVESRGPDAPLKLNLDEMVI